MARQMVWTTLKYPYYALVHNLNLNPQMAAGMSLWKQGWAQMKGERVHFELWMGGPVKDLYHLSM